MSSGLRVPHNVAWGYAKEVVNLLSPLCERVEIAGSLRRLQLEVRDIEIVCIPKEAKDLVGTKFYPCDAITATLTNAYDFIKGASAYQKYFVGDRDLGVNKESSSIALDLFITTPEKWGVIFTIRTGCADFSHRLVTPKQQGGYLPGFLRVKDGRLQLRASGALLDTPEERDVFRTLDLKWIEPMERNS